MREAKTVQCVGVNDCGYPVTVYAVINGRKTQLWICPFYRVWTDMLKRCYSPKYQSHQPTYIGCSVAPEWHSFSTFREWMALQDWEDKQIDKDIISHGNKVYSPIFCVFVSAELNSFLTDSAAARGQWPIGVNWHNKTKKFASCCRNPFTGMRESLGYYDCPFTAHEAWRKRKHQHACAYAEQQTDTRIAQALRLRFTKPISEDAESV